MNLHRSGKRPEWEMVDGELNAAQKVAARTKGVVTPGNAVSLTGAALVTSGLIDANRGHKKRALAKVVVGRLADLLDGTAADKTGTKSPLGEAMDVSIDKAEMAAALPILVRGDFVPTDTAAALAVPHVVNTVLTAIAKRRGNDIHPTGEGKQATGYQWGALAAYAVGSIVGDYSPTVGKKFDRLGDMLAGVSLYLGAVAIKDYAQDAFAQPVPEADSVTLEI